MTAGIAGIGSESRPRRTIRAGNPEGPREETSLLAFISVLLKHRRTIAACALAGTVIMGALSAAKADKYSSGVAFIVKNARTPVQIPGGAAALGISLSNYGDFGQTVAFFADLTRSGLILRNVAAQSYATSDGGPRKPLATIYGIEEPDRKVAIELATDRLSKDVTYNVTSRTGVVRISVQAHDPLLAQQLANAILAELGKWSQAEGHNQAVLERRFLEQLASDARVKLDQAERAASTFLAVNRLGASSPQLRLEYDRLQRDVELRQQVYTAVVQSLEQARIEEVRAPTVLNVVETADLPVEPQRREALRNTLFGTAGGIFVGIVLAMLGQRVNEKKAYA